MVVLVPYPGASPETVEREIIDRIEKALQSIPQVYEIKSEAHEGMAQIVIQFTFKKNMVEASDEIRNAIASVRYKLPPEMREPILRRFDPNSQPIMQIALSSSTQSHSELSRLAEDEFADRFRSIDGVSTVDIIGSLRRELSVLLHADKLREYNVSAGQVINALSQQNTTAPVGRVTGPLNEQSIRLVGRIENPAEFEQVVVKRDNNEMVRLGQVATIRDGYAELTGHSLRNGHENVGFAISRSRDASTVAVAEKIRQMVNEISKTLPNGTKLEVTYDGGKDAQSSLNNVIEALIFGAVLTILVVYAFLNSWRSTLITGLSLPTSAITAFIAVWLCGFTLNFMTLLALSLAIGVLIDDAIVVRENIVRHMERGVERKLAAQIGTSEIGLAVTATTFSIIAVFLPVAFMGGITGEWFRPFALTVAASVIVSLFISFTLDPMLSAYWGDPPHRERATRGVGLWLANFNEWFDHQCDRYTKVINWALHHRKSIALIGVASFVLAILMIGFKLVGSGFLPQSDNDTIAIDVRTPSSTSLEYARLKVEKAAELVRAEIPEVKSTDSDVKPNGGRVYVNVGKKNTRKRSAAELSTAIRETLSRLVGAEYSVIGDLNNDGQKPVNLTFYGTDSRKLVELTTQYMNELAKVPGAVDVGLSQQEPKDELKVELDRGLANSMGISVGDAAQTLRVAFAGVEVGDWIDPTGEARDVAVRLHPDDRVNPSNIEHLPIAVAGTNMMVPLNQIATITMGKGLPEIQHVDGKKMIAVSANAQGRSEGEVTAAAVELAKEMHFPAGYGYQLGGASRDQQEVFSEMGIALIMGIAVMYLVLVIQFGSFTAPLPVMISLPLSLIGVVVALFLTHGTFNLMSFIGVIMLVGLVAKNAILLLDCARKEEAKGVNREEALMHAGRSRLRPILMTTFALIAGMLPVAIGMGDGGEFYRPMAVAIIGGTITATMLTLLVVPTLYDSIEIARDRMFVKFQSRAERISALPAFVVTATEAVLTLLLMRYLFRSAVNLYSLFRRGPLAPA
jgi:HAE1 family hydrophobic/amphiphilic exporter-1